MRDDPGRGVRPPFPASFALASGILALLAAAAGTATETRVNSLGGRGDYFEDVANVLAWYGSLSAYPNLAVAELGTFDAARGDEAADRQATRQGAGAHLALGPEGRDGVAATYLFGEGDTGGAPAARMLLYGRAWSGGRAAIALGLSAADWEEPAEGGTWSRRSEDAVFGLGVRWDVGPGAYAEVAGEAIRDRRQQSAAPLHGRLDHRGWGSFGLRARLFWEPRTGWILTPVAAYDRRDTWELPGEPAGPGRLDAWSERLGVGLTRLPHPDVQLLATLEYHRARLRRGVLLADGTTLATEGAREEALHARLGVEARVRPWLSLRAGARNAPGRFGMPAVAGLSDAEDFDLTLGLGAHLGACDVDLLLNDDAPFNLGSLLTNAGGDEPATFTSASLTWAF